MAKKKKSFKIGDKVKIIKASSGHGIPLGTSCNIMNISNNMYMMESFPNWWIYPTDFEESFQTRELFQVQIKQLREDLSEAEEKLNWMLQTDSQVFDLDEFKIFKILELMKNADKTDDVSQIRLTKQIAKLVKKD